MKHVFINVLKFYKGYVSAPLVLLFGNACKQQPTCSEYAIEKIEEKGLIRGLYLSVKRFLSCR